MMKKPALWFPNPGLKTPQGQQTSISPGALVQKHNSPSPAPRDSDSENPGWGPGIRSISKYPKQSKAKCKKNNY